MQLYRIIDPKVFRSQWKIQNTLRPSAASTPLAKRAKAIITVIDRDRASVLEPAYSVIYTFHGTSVAINEVIL